MDSHRTTKTTLAIGITLAVLLDTAGQTLWKFVATKFPIEASLGSTFQTALREPMVYVLVVIFLCQLIVWLRVLEHADLSYAQPMTSMSYISVCMLSAYFYGEQISVNKILGIACILAGVWLVSRGSYRTTERSET